MDLLEFLDNSDSNTIIVGELVKTNFLEKEYIGLQLKNGNTIYNLVDEKENLILEGQGPKVTDYQFFYSGNSELPPPQEKTYFIVSKKVREKEENVKRTDLLSPTGYGGKTKDEVFRKITGLE